MKSKIKSIITPVSFGVIPDYKSYWATHFYSALTCLDSHKNLMHSPHNLASFPIWSMALLRGHLPPNFFDHIENYMRNWGAQYFFASFFNQNLDGGVVLELVERLEEFYEENLSSWYNQFTFYVSGNDSTLSYNLDSRFTELFPFKINGKEANIDLLVAYSDLCLVLEDEFSDRKVGLFGEVEGIYGNKFRSESYWGRKQDFCVFGIGSVDGDQKMVYFQESHFKNISRIHLLIEKSHPVVSDFWQTLNWFKMLFLYGPQVEIYGDDDEANYFINKMKQSWSFPITNVLKDLERYIDGGLVGFNPSGPASVITDITI